jgi:VWFA-related protein
MDTFSRLNFGETRRRLQVAGVPIYSIGLMQALREYYDALGYLGPIARMDFIQADNQLRTFSSETGGMAFFPKFEGEFPGIFASIADGLRNQYSLAYSPTNQAKDGEFRRIEVELVDPETGENLRIVDQRDRSIRYRIIAKNGYRAPREVE